jgi:hypothetical protein
LKLEGDHHRQSFPHATEGHTMFNSAMTYTRTIARHAGVLAAAMLLTAAVSVAMPQQAQAATNSAGQATAVNDGVTPLAVSLDGAFVVTKGQKG